MDNELTLAEAAENFRTAKAAAIEAQQATSKAQRAARDSETALVMAKSGMERAERVLIETALKQGA